ncbi:MAG: orotate phosphoribosyltransferase [Coriobacteriia bacterium]|nr:orotate phosphoribosyltransferase [Coriobacteriia bacterium]
MSTVELTTEYILPLSDGDVLRILKDTQAVRTGHFKLTSGLHSDTYIQCARILEHPRLTALLAAETVSRLPDDIREQIDLVVSPAVGGILFGFAIASALNTPMIFTERVDGAMALRRAFEIPAGSNVLIAEDVVTSGGSVEEVAQVVKANKANVLAVVSLVDRGGERLFSEAFYPLLRRATPSWEPDNCELCKNDIPIDSPGSRILS